MTELAIDDVFKIFSFYEKQPMWIHSEGLKYGNSNGHFIIYDEKQ